MQPLTEELNVLTSSRNGLLALDRANYLCKLALIAAISFVFTLIPLLVPASNFVQLVTALAGLVHIFSFIGFFFYFLYWFVRHVLMRRLDRTSKLTRHSKRLACIAFGIWALTLAAKVLVSLLTYKEATAIVD